MNETEQRLKIVENYFQNSACAPQVPVKVLKLCSGWQHGHPSVEKKKFFTFFATTKLMVEL